MPQPDLFDRHRRELLRELARGGHGAEHGAEYVRARHQREFTESLIEQIKAGTAPWQKHWKPGERVLAENAVTGDPFDHGNSLHLAVKAQQRGFADNRWVTSRDIAAAGAHVRTGERGETVYFFDETRLIGLADERGVPVKDAKGDQVYEKRTFWRPDVAFNVEQVRGLDLPPRPARKADWQVHQAAEAVIEESQVHVMHAPGPAYYSPPHDTVVLPDRSQFASPDDYYARAMHQLAHATGHEKRMARETFREGNENPGGLADAREELRAELSAMMAGERLGIGHRPQHGIHYVAGWVRALEDDSQEIYRAATEASKMSAHLIDPARDRIDTIDARAAEHRKERSRDRSRSLPARQPTPQPDRGMEISR